jgi:hypothetical protein
VCLSASEVLSIQMADVKKAGDFLNITDTDQLKVKKI